MSVRADSNGQTSKMKRPTYRFRRTWDGGGERSRKRDDDSDGYHEPPDARAQPQKRGRAA